MNWKDIKDYEGYYQVSDNGVIKSLDRTDIQGHFRKGQIIKTSISTKGYERVGLRKDGTKRLVSVHRLVAEAFIPNKNKLDTVNHKDENKRNNDVNNLEWSSTIDNIRYGTGIRRKAESQTNCIKRSKQIKSINTINGYINLFGSIREAGRYGFDRQIISKCLLEPTKIYRACYWRCA